MRKQAIIICSIAILLTIIVNIGDLRCQENSNMIAEKYQSNNMEKFTDEINDNNVKDDKNIGVEILGLMIQHNLFYQYQKMDPKELEDRLEISR